MMKGRTMFYHPREDEYVIGKKEAFVIHNCLHFYPKNTNFAYKSIFNKKNRAIQQYITTKKTIAEKTFLQ